MSEVPTQVEVSPLRIGIAIAMIAIVTAIGVGAVLYSRHIERERDVAQALARVEQAQSALDYALSTGDTEGALRQLPQPERGHAMPPHLLTMMQFNVEQAELLCRQDGIECEQSRLLRRQYEAYEAMR